MVRRLGTPNTFEEPNFPDRLNFELVSTVSPLPNGLAPLPVNTEIMSWGDGTAGKYPNKLEDGLFLTMANPAKLTLDQRNSLNIKHNSFYDFAANSNNVVWCVFTNNTTIVTGMDNKTTTYNTGVDPHVPNFNAGPPVTPVYSPSYKPGIVGSNSVSGLEGQFTGWFSQSHISPTLAANTFGTNDDVKVVNGKLEKGASGDLCIGKVERVYVSTVNGNVKVRCRINASMPYVKP